VTEMNKELETWEQFSKRRVAEIEERVGHKYKSAEEFNRLYGADTLFIEYSEYCNIKVVDEGDDFPGRANIIMLMPNREKRQKTDCREFEYCKTHEIEVDCAGCDDYVYANKLSQLVIG